MAILLPAEMITEARRDCVDTDSVDPAFSDAVYLTKLNKYYYLWYEKVERRTIPYGATATGLSFATGVFYAPTSSKLNIFAIDRAYLAADGTSSLVFTGSLEIVDPAIINRLVLSDSVPATPTKISFHRELASSVSTIGNWRALVHPIPSAETTYVTIMARAWPALLTAASANPPDVTELAAYTISKLAAAEIAGMMGEDENFIGHILRDVSDEIMAQIGIPRPGFKPPSYEERAA